MLKFFRPIRKKLLQENRITKYLVYAFGEIILVVIGILIALNINNKNQERKNNTKLNAIYLETQKDLAVTINEVTQLIEFYEQTDSIANLILNNELSKQDYLEHPEYAFMFNEIGFHLPINKGYKNLTANLDLIPVSFKPSLELLDNLYSTQITVNKESSDILLNFVIDYTDWLSKTKPWYHNLKFNGKLSDEVLRFLINDDFYKNYVYDYTFYSKVQAFGILKSKAVIAYKNLSITTGNNADIEDYYFLTGDALKKYVGTYKLTSNSEIFNDDGIRNIIKVSLIDESLHVKLFGKHTIQLFAHLEHSFIFNDGDTAQFTFNLNGAGKIIGMEVFNEMEHTNWIKVE